MTVEQLIARLKECDPKSQVVIDVRTQTTVYPSAYCEPWGDIDTNIYNERTIHITLPKGMYIGERKAKRE